MSSVRGGQYGCGVGLAQVAVDSHAQKSEKLFAGRSFDPPDRASHPRTTHRGDLHGMAGLGWNHILGHTDVCICL